MALFVQSVDGDSPAVELIRSGDILLTANDVVLHQGSDLRTAATQVLGGQLLLRIQRNGSELPQPIVVSVPASGVLGFNVVTAQPYTNQVGATPTFVSRVPTDLQKARSKASSLNGIAATVAGLGIAGGVILLLVGLVVAANDEVGLGISLMSSGIVGILFWLLIGSFAQTVAQAVIAWTSTRESG